MDPHDTTRPTRPDIPDATASPPRTFGSQGPTLGDLIDAYLQDYRVRQFRSVSTARGRTAHLAACFGRAARAAALTTYQIRQYQLARRAAGAATGTINRETSALHRMCTLAVHWGWLDTVPGFPDRRSRRQFSDEFRAGAVRLVLEEGKTVGAVARELDLTESALRQWVERARADRSGGRTGLTTAEREELARLRKENRILAEERDILKKATAFFAKQSR